MKAQSSPEERAKNRQRIGKQMATNKQRNRNKKADNIAAIRL